MTLQQLKYVATVAKIGKINEAAKALFISQPSLTNAVKALEEEMGITIFRRTNKGIVVSNEGDEFLAYARQVLEQAELMEERYKKSLHHRQQFSVSTQHYSFAVNAFVDVIREFGEDSYDFTLRETQTNEIITDVSRLKSEIGVIYLSSINRPVIEKMIRNNELEFTTLFKAKPHVFISKRHPLVEASEITLEDLEAYPYLSFEQGDYNAFYYSEEIVSTIDRPKNIIVRDRATLFNCLIGLNGYTVSTGVLDSELNGPDIVARALSVDEVMEVGILTRKNARLSKFGEAYVTAIKNHID